MKKNYIIHSFNKSNYNFYNLILTYVRLLKKFDRIETLEEIPLIGKKSDITDIEQVIYKCFKSDEFRKMYQRFNSEIVSPILSRKYRVQKIPSVRISFPGEKSVNFHNDCWYGHGKHIQNIWVPLMNVRGAQCLAFLNKEENKRALDYFYSKEPSLEKIQRYCEKRLELAELNYGQFISFPTSALHGTKVNDTKKIRISFDFRLLFDNDKGHKSDDFFIDIDKLYVQKQKIKNSPRTRPAVAYVSQRDMNKNLYISQTIQIEANINYALKNNFYILAHEAELMGFKKLLNFEDIINGNRKNLAKDLIIFSDKFLKTTKNKYIGLVKIALKNGYKLHFVNEGYILQDDISNLIN
jgi:hypothetical protein